MKISKTTAHHGTHCLVSDYFLTAPTKTENIYLKKNFRAAKFSEAGGDEKQKYFLIGLKCLIVLFKW
jgi:hypothetical protein